MLPPPEALLTRQPAGILTLSDLSTEPDTSLYTPCHKSVLFQDGPFFPQPRAFGVSQGKKALVFLLPLPSFSKLGMAQTLKLLTDR